MKTIKIFLASSAELEVDRDAFERFLYRKSIQWKNDRDTFLELSIWENFIDAMSQTRLQDEYNKAIEESEIFVMLFWTKVGKYTWEEFDTARAQFQKNHKPVIYTYFKQTGTSDQKEKSLEDFQKTLKDMGHFETPYKNTEGLLLHFSGQLDKLYPLQHSPNMILSKQEILDLVNQGNLFEAFERLNAVLNHKNDSLNALESELINQPNNFNMATFTLRLRLFVNRQF